MYTSLSQEELDTIKILHNMTGLSYINCKQAVYKCGTDINKCYEYLRSQHLSPAIKIKTKEASVTCNKNASVK